jgi:hypothetical protein
VQGHFSFALLIIDRTEGTLAFARHELASLERRLRMPD